MKAELEKLIDLQKTDTNIRRLKKAIETADQRRADIQQEFEQHASSIREIQTRSETAKTERDRLETQIAENKTYLERADRNLKHAQNQKEYETAMRETDALQKQIAALEAQVLEKMTTVEEVEKILAERSEEVSSLESNRQSELETFENELGANRDELDSEMKKRHDLFVTLPTNPGRRHRPLSKGGSFGPPVADAEPL